MREHEWNEDRFCKHCGMPMEETFGIVSWCPMPQNVYDLKVWHIKRFNAQIYAKVRNYVPK